MAMVLELDVRAALAEVVLGMRTPHVSAAKIPEARPADSLLKPVLELEGMVDGIFPQSPMFVYLPFEGGFIRILRAPTGETNTALSIEGRESSFGRSIGHAGQLGSISHRTENETLKGQKSIVKIIEDINVVIPRISVALSHPPIESSLIYKSTSAAAVGQ